MYICISASKGFKSQFEKKGTLTYPCAQFPFAEPPLSVHSVEVKQVPLRATDLKMIKCEIKIKF